VIKKKEEKFKFLLPYQSFNASKKMKIKQVFFMSWRKC